MSILGKIVGQLESVGDGGSSGGSSGMNYIKTEKHKLVQNSYGYRSGFVIAKFAEDNKVYKFDVKMALERNSKPYTIYLSGFTYNKKVFILNYQIPSGLEDGHAFIRDDKIVLGGYCLYETYIQIEGYTTLTQEEIVWEDAQTTGNDAIEESTSIFNCLESLESKVSSLESAKSTIESRLTALESAGSG